MKMSVVKVLAESHAVEDLRRAETALENGERPAIDVEGEDEGEQLTHVIAAITILECMRDKNVEFRDALREYTQRVRSSIS